MTYQVDIFQFLQHRRMKVQTLQELNKCPVARVVDNAFLAPIGLGIQRADNLIALQPSLKPVT